ncbi:MAG: hypothetical protein K2M67_04735 [Muribaculaceae bacterium]|nr:hypothetical protein [Muribaculaceae bacterium]
MKRSLLLPLGVLISTAVYADGVVTPTPGPDYTVVIIKRRKNPVPTPTHPRMPGRIETLEVRYSEGMLLVDFPEDTESATVTLSTGAFPVFSAGIDRGYPCMELPDLSGDFLLNVTFDNGDEYEGEISF